MTDGILQIKLMVLGVEVDAELADPEYITRTHGTPSCYMKGCKGPLCTYIGRLKKRTENTQPYADKEVDEFLQEKLNTHHEARKEILANRRRS